MSDTLIKVENLSKKFCKSMKRSMYYGSVDILRSMLGISYPTETLRKGEFWALKDINFELKRGETLGLIGMNGSGKSTLLRMLSGIFPPDKGKITINGSVGSLIAVGAGFHPHMSGRENIYLNGTILGMSRKEIKRKFDEIVDFAEIEDFLDAPVSTYSSGMRVRLGFAIAVHREPDILLVDEVLAVGDARFQRKCINKLNEIQRLSTSIILVSHNMQTIEAMCMVSVLLKKGKQILHGNTRSVIPYYETDYKEEAKLTLQDNKIEIQSNELNLINQYSNYGTNEIRVLRCYFNNQTEKSVFQKPDEKLQLNLKFESDISIEQIICLIRFYYIQEPTKKTYLTDIDTRAVIGQRFKMKINRGKSLLMYRLPLLHFVTGHYFISIRFFDSLFSKPYFQGEYGIVKLLNEHATNNRAGTSVPYIWTNAEIILKQEQ